MQQSRTLEIDPLVGSDEMAARQAWIGRHMGIGRGGSDSLVASDLPFSFLVAGKPVAGLLGSWMATRSTRDLGSGKTEHTLGWADPGTGLVIRCVAVEYADFPVIEWTVWLRNEGSSDAPVLSDILGINAYLPGAADGKGLLHWFVGSQAVIEDFRPQAEYLVPGPSRHFQPVGGRPSNGTMPYFNVDYGDQGIIIAIGWPGQWAADIGGAGDGARVRGGQARTRIALHPGEEIRTPLIALLFWKGGDWIRSQNLWRRWMMAHNMPRPGGELPKPFTGTCVDDFFPGMLSNAAGIMGYMDLYREHGVHLDYWWTDAGWFRNVTPQWWSSVGSWEPDPVRYPKGLKEVSDHAHRLGMKYVVWFEPERVSPASWLYENHPEWLLGDDGQQKLLNLGNGEALRWLVEHTDRLITEQGVDLYRQDFNCDPLPYWEWADRPDRIGLTENLYVRGHLAFWDELMRRHTDMLIDNCASGGRRLDLESLRRSVPNTRTDYRFEPTGTQGQHYGISFWIPFSGSGVYQDTPYVMRCHMNSAFGYGVNFGCVEALPGSSFKPGEKQVPDWELLRRMDAEWHSIAADGFLGDYYPLTAYSLQNDVWMAWQFNRPEMGTGYVQAFRRPESKTGSRRLRLRGLDPQACYRLIISDRKRRVVADGHELMTAGMLVRLPSQPDSAIVVYERL